MSKGIIICQKNCSSLIPKHEFVNDDLIILNSITNLDKIRSFIDNQDINQYMSFIVDRLFASNKYFNDQEPWKKKDDKLRLYTIVYTAIELIRKITFMLYPIIPNTSIKALKIFDIKENEIEFDTIKDHNFLKQGNKINSIDILFKKIDKKND